MSFVYEKIPDKERYRLNGIKSPVHGSDLKKANLDVWIIDRECDAFLMYLGNPGAKLLNLPSHWVFSWNGHFIYLEELEESSGNAYTVEGKVVRRKLRNFHIPEDLSEDKQQISDLLREAFEAYGFAGRTANVTVEVVF